MRFICHAVNLLNARELHVLRKHPAFQQIWNKDFKAARSVYFCGLHFMRKSRQAPHLSHAAQIEASAYRGGVAHWKLIVKLDLVQIARTSRHTFGRAALC